MQAIRPLRPVSLDSPSATFLVVGGFGGIGQAVVSWMLHNEAQNVLLTSRNAERHVEDATLLRNVLRKDQHLHVHDRDVSSEESLLKLLLYARANMARIRGVVDSAMVLDMSKKTAFGI